MKSIALDTSEPDSGANNITILAVADEVSPVLYDYFRPDRWSDVDLILSCGDLPPYYLDFLCSSLNVPLLYVRGNHDSAWSTDDYRGGENLNGKIVTIKGIRIAGLEGSRRYNRSGCQHTEPEMRRIVRRLRLRAFRSGRPSIVVTHSPPAGINDGSDLAHQGFESFRTLIDAWHPQLFIHGHSHAYYRSCSGTVLGHTRVLNAYPYRLIKVPVSS